MSLNNKQKSLCQMTPTQLILQGDKEISKQQENDRIAFESVALDLWFLVYSTRWTLVS